MGVGKGDDGVGRRERGREKRVGKTYACAPLVRPGQPLSPAPRPASASTPASSSSSSEFPHHMRPHQETTLPQTPPRNPRLFYLHAAKAVPLAVDTIRARAPVPRLGGRPLRVSTPGWAAGCISCRGARGGSGGRGRRIGCG